MCRGKNPSQSPAFNKRVAICLLLLIVSFASLVPGGPIENRDFSHLSPQVFWGFNAFLLGLGFVSLIVIFFAWQGKKTAFWTAIIIAWMFVGVFILDWSKVFPTSPDPMGVGLCMVEILGLMLCVYILLFSHKALGHI